VSAEGVQAKNVLQFESEFNAELNKVLIGLKKERNEKMKIANKS
jgi:hypothetical protein